jgi:hypothetical protein
MLVGELWFDCMLEVITSRELDWLAREFRHIRVSRVTESPVSLVAENTELHWVTSRG